MTDHSRFSARRARAACAFLAGLGLAAPAFATPALAAESKVPMERATLSGDYLSARAATAEHDTDAAAQFLARALNEDPANPVLIERTFLIKLANGNLEAAMPLASKLMQQKSAQGLARLALGVQAIKDKSYIAARASLAGADQTPVGVLTVGLLSAWAEQGQNNTDAALKIIDGLNGPEWYGVFKNFHRSLIAEAAGRQEDALKWMRAADEADGTGVRMAEGVARVMARSGDTQGALKALDDFTAQAREHPVVDALRAEIVSGKTPAPLVANPQEGAAEVLYGLGVALNSSGGEDLSTVYLQLALYLDPTGDLTQLAVGELFQTARNYEKAIEAFTAVREDSPLKRMAIIDTALSLDALDRPDDAAAELKKLLAKQPGDNDASLALGDIYRNHKRFEDAVTAYSAAVAVVPDPSRSQWRLFYSRGIAYERTDRWPEAEADFRKALVLFPNQPQVLNYLGYSWVDKGLHLNEALDMIKAAVDLRPDDGYIVDSLGWAYYRTARYDDAVTQLERAVQLKPEDPTINDHLGDAYYRVGRRLEARFQWNHARDLGPEADDLAKIVKKIEVGAPADAGKNG